jgi:hypothetical protein
MELPAVPATSMASRFMDDAALFIMFGNTYLNIDVSIHALVCIQNSFGH